MSVIRRVRYLEDSPYWKVVKMSPFPKKNVHYWEVSVSGGYTVDEFTVACMEIKYCTFTRRLSIETWYSHMGQRKQLVNYMVSKQKEKICLKRNSIYYDYNILTYTILKCS